MNEQIGIIAPMPMELEPLKTAAEIKEMVVKSGFTIYEGLLAGKKVTMTCSGMGKVNAACAAQVLIDHCSITHVLLSGIGGALDSRCQPGDVVIPQEVRQYDVGIVERDRYTPTGITCFDEKGKATIMPAFYPDPKLRALALAASSTEELPAKGGRRPEVFEGLIITGDQLVASTEVLRWFGEKLSAIAVDMESAALGQVCSKAGVPFLIVRCISDRALDLAELDIGKLAKINFEASTFRKLTGLGGYLLTHPTSVKKLMDFSQDMKRAAEVSAAVTKSVLKALT